jgi:hypothetical protein
MKSQAIQRHQLGARDRDKMFLLLNKHFSGVVREVFDSDLDEKNWVVLVENEEGQLVGFSTIFQYESEYDGETINVIYSGDTIMDRSAWHSLCLPRVWIETVREIYRSGQGRRLVWLLITSGYRTYRFLPVFCKQYYPRYDQDTPPDVSEIMNHLARERFGDKYDQDLGIVRFEHPHRLIDELAVVPEGRLSDPHVACFNQLNPGHARGDELVCFAEINDDNLSAAGRRMLPAGLARKKIA